MEPLVWDELRFPWMASTGQHCVRAGSSGRTHWSSAGRLGLALEIDLYNSNTQIGFSSIL